MDSREIICKMELWLDLQAVVSLKDIWAEKIRGIDFYYSTSLLLTANTVSKSAGTDAILCITLKMD